MIKAIETEYKGHRFRSRLEARWAVFFDALGIKWEYEPQGFDLADSIFPNCGNYLPDFHLPELKVWVEVKSGKPLEDQEIMKLVAFSMESSIPFLVTKGLPHQGFVLSNLEHLFPPDDSCRCPHQIIAHCIFGVGRKCENEIWIVEKDGNWGHCLNPISSDTRYPMTECEKLDNAYKAARQARFEYDQIGAPSEWE